MTVLIIIAVAILAFLYWKRWLTFTYTGVTRPLCQVSLFGVNIAIKKPAPIKEPHPDDRKEG